MAVYCVGDISAKRTAFRKQESGKICIDNDEVLSTVVDGNKVYFLIGSVPFSDMKVIEYISYQRALLCKNQTHESEIKYYARLFGFKIPLKRKMKRLDALFYKMAQCLAKFSLPTEEIYINLDGLDFTKKRATVLKKMLRKIENYFKVFVSVSDYRFIPTASAVRLYNSDGTTCEINRSSYECTRSKKKKVPSIDELLENDNLKIKKITVAGI